jgi:hypothetical protein
MPPRARQTDSEQASECQDLLQTLLELAKKAGPKLKEAAKSDGIVLALKSSLGETPYEDWCKKFDRIMQRDVLDAHGHMPLLQGGRKGIVHFLNRLSAVMHQGSRNVA